MEKEMKKEEEVEERKKEGKKEKTKRQFSVHIAKQVAGGRNWLFFSLFFFFENKMSGDH